MAEEEKKVVAQTEPEQKPEQKNVDEEVQRLKAMLSKANSEAAGYRRKLEEKETAEQTALRERQEAEQKLREELEEYRKRERISTYKSKLMEAGVPSDMADKMATSLPDGVSDDYFATTKAFFEKKTQDIRAEALNAQPKLSAGIPPTGQTAAEAEEAKMRKWFGL